MTLIKYGLLITILGLSGCTNKPMPKPLLYGKLYYAVSTRIMSTDLLTKERKLLSGGYEDKILFNYVSLHDNGIMVESCDMVKGCSVKLFSLPDKDFITITDGVMPTYVKSSNILYYYTYENKGKTIRLYAKSLDLERKEVLVIEETKQKNDESVYFSFAYSVVSISTTQIVFRDINNELEIYDSVKNNLQKTGIKGFIPFVWRSKTNSLICKSIDDEDYYEINIQSKSKKKLPNLNKVTDGILYIPDFDCLIYSKYRLFSLAGRADVYVYWLSNNKKDKLWSDDYIVSATWSPK